MQQTLIPLPPPRVLFLLFFRPCLFVAPVPVAMSDSNQSEMCYSAVRRRGGRETGTRSERLCYDMAHHHHHSSASQTDRLQYKWV